MSVKTLEQGRAEEAYKCAVVGKQRHGDDYKSYVKKLPMLIKTNGLGASIVFYAGNKDAHILICEQILSWIKQSPISCLFNLGEANKAVDFAKMIAELESSEYRALTIEVLAFLNWLKRFSDAL